MKNFLLLLLILTLSACSIVEDAYKARVGAYFPQQRIKYITENCKEMGFKEETKEFQQCITSSLEAGLYNSPKSSISNQPKESKMLQHGLGKPLFDSKTGLPN
ncbi:hypothetical protein OAD15_07090 [Hyphomicrobiales bacterium]|nr:hypothetical protein [Hyphomicrobiales bacterium]